MKLDKFEKWFERVVFLAIGSVTAMTGAVAVMFLVIGRWDIAQPYVILCGLGLATYALTKLVVKVHESTRNWLEQ